MKSLFTLFLVLVTSGLAFSQDKPKKIKHGLRFSYMQKSMHDGHRQREFTKVELYLYKKETRFTFENIKNVKIAVFRRGKLKTIKDALLKSYPTSIQRYFIVLEGLPKDPWKHGYHYGVIFDYKEPAGIKTVRYISSDKDKKNELFQTISKIKHNKANKENHGMHFDLGYKRIANFNNTDTSKSFTQVSFTLSKTEMFSFAKMSNVKIGIFENGQPLIWKNAVFQKNPNSRDEYFIILEDFPPSRFYQQCYFGVTFNYQYPTKVKRVRYVTRDYASPNSKESLQVLDKKPEADKHANPKSRLLTLYCYPPSVAAAIGHHTSYENSRKGERTIKNHQIYCELKAYGFDSDDVREMKLYLLKGGEIVQEFDGEMINNQGMKERQLIRFEADTKDAKIEFKKQDPVYHFGARFVIKNDTYQIEVIHIDRDPANSQSKDRLIQKPVIEKKPDENQ